MGLRASSNRWQGLRVLAALSLIRLRVLCRLSADRDPYGSETRRSLLSGCSTLIRIRRSSFSPLVTCVMIGIGTSGLLALPRTQLPPSRLPSETRSLSLSHALQAGRSTQVLLGNSAPPLALLSLR
ncbi:hypothetical protein OG21DRAFT_1193582 [Imleria badia]|nr:hypothetical protein OG21DRAFT_1193582 [Imleria badia]